MYCPYFFDIKKRTKCLGIQELFKGFNYQGIMICKLITAVVVIVIVINILLVVMMIIMLKIMILIMIMNMKKL